MNRRQVRRLVTHADCGHRLDRPIYVRSGAEVGTSCPHHIDGRVGVVWVEPYAEGPPPKSRKR